MSHVQQQLTQVIAAPRVRQHQSSLLTGWLKQANTITAAPHSKTLPIHVFDGMHAQHGGCSWWNNMVTLQAYVLHLQRSNRESISNSLDLSLLSVL